MIAPPKMSQSREGSNPWFSVTSLGNVKSATPVALPNLGKARSLVGPVLLPRKSLTSPGAQIPQGIGAPRQYPPAQRGYQQPGGFGVIANTQCRYIYKNKYGKS